MDRIRSYTAFFTVYVFSQKRVFRGAACTENSGYETFKIAEYARDLVFKVSQFLGVFFERAYTVFFGRF